ncbi:MAG TPA: TylF/MycF/NovP-related O-methyltransferase [Acidobacteriota bacterium]
MGEILFHSPWRRYFFPRYLYNFTPPQLCFLCQCIEDTAHVAGAVVEVGCSIGSTTVFLNKAMDALNIEKEYLALDTFSGFAAGDTRFEVAERGKSRDLFNAFQVNKRKWFDDTMRRNGITRVRSIAADVNECDLTMLGPISFSLLDVDLYRPMKKGLPELYEVLSPGGIIVVDDCTSANRTCDGSEQAYREFMKERGLLPQIVLGKLGVVRKQG